MIWKSTGTSRYDRLNREEQAGGSREGHFFAYATICRWRWTTCETASLDESLAATLVLRDTRASGMLIAYELNEPKDAPSSIDKAEDLEWSRRFPVMQARLKPAGL